MGPEPNPGDRGRCVSEPSLTFSIPYHSKLCELAIILLNKGS